MGADTGTDTGTDDPGGVELIGLHGRKQAGKDTCGARLVAAHGYSRVAFADPLRLFLTKLDPLVGRRGDALLRLSTVLAEVGGDWDRLKDEERDPVHREIRVLLQRVGNEAGKAVFGETVWAQRGLAAARRLGGRVVFTDVRFDVEAEAVVAAGGRVVHVVRPGAGGSADPHASEAGIDPRWITTTIVNDGTIEQLEQKVDALVLSLRGR
ncbi:deoxynucleotide monophosphate kinase family protein [Kocuria sp. U4B]